MSKSVLCVEIPNTLSLDGGVQWLKWVQNHIETQNIKYVSWIQRGSICDRSLPSSMVLSQARAWPQEITLLRQMWLDWFHFMHTSGLYFVYWGLGDCTGLAFELALHCHELIWGDADSVCGSDFFWGDVYQAPVKWQMARKIAHNRPATSKGVLSQEILVQSSVLDGVMLHWPYFFKHKHMPYSISGLYSAQELRRASKKHTNSMLEKYQDWWGGFSAAALKKSATLDHVLGGGGVIFFEALSLELSRLDLMVIEACLDAGLWVIVYGISSTMDGSVWVERWLSGFTDRALPKKHRMLYLSPSLWAEEARLRYMCVCIKGEKIFFQKADLCFVLESVRIQTLMWVCTDCSMEHGLDAQEKDFIKNICDYLPGHGCLYIKSSDSQGVSLSEYFLHIGDRALTHFASIFGCEPEVCKSLGRWKEWPYEQQSYFLILLFLWLEDILSQGDGFRLSARALEAWLLAGVGGDEKDAGLLRQVPLQYAKRQLLAKCSVVSAPEFVQRARCLVEGAYGGGAYGGGLLAV